LVAEAIDILPLLSESLPLGLVHGLESPRTVPVLRCLVERRAYEVSYGGSHAAPADYARARPDPWWPGFFVLPAVLKVGCDAVLPLAVLPMLPSLMSEDRIITVTAGIDGVRWVIARVLVVRGVVVAKVVVLV
jgi:hypothetical protein